MKMCASRDGAPKGLQVQIAFGDTGAGRTFAEDAATEKGRKSLCAMVPEVFKQDLGLPSTGIHWLPKTNRLICNFGDTNQPGFEQVVAQSPPPEPQKKSEQAMPDLAGPAKKLLARDLAAQTSKWDGQRIETTMSCFYADRNDYRCIGGGTRIDVSRVANAEGRQWVEDRCDTLSKSTSRACNFRIVFVYGRYTTHRVSDRSEITLVLPVGEVAELYPASSGRR